MKDKYHYGDCKEDIQQDFDQTEEGVKSSYYSLDKEEQELSEESIAEVQECGVRNHKAEVKVSIAIEHKNVSPDINLGTKVSTVTEKESKGRLMCHVLQKTTTNCSEIRASSNTSFASKIQFEY